MHHDDGEWGGYTYEWNDEQTDASLLPSGKLKTVGDQQWTSPSRSDCMRCHTKAAGRALGPEIAQLNGDLVYPTTNRVANQLATQLSVVSLRSDATEVKPMPPIRRHLVDDKGVAVLDQWIRGLSGCP